ncbi:Adenylyltransferase and sulfurtransferase MOCS3 [Hypsizygus marmoreus]|uniref:Adenylyltransferase and sulfurtransferase MOCS3 n=1 Tax=Hypsizygus marmoreus TaxID=39966 RepID=A0A369JU45_HYPMA|nr:Adenylyltransferase and sulfurtransferase MOCS3 [Hypsizygus marmoreus]
MLPLEDYQRYGRQMILDGFGLPGQLKLQKSSVVVVGAGGLGCPALQYLGAAGVGRIGIIDHDRVELSNLGRQILHSEETVGMFKAESAALALKRLNSHLTVDIYTTALSSENALSLLQSYDIILDCTDNAPTRYLLSDTAVALNKPLVSGAAQKFEGQLCVYNLGGDGPCYRCLYPRPPAQELTGSCEETGILGAVTGVIGNLQALETIKIITGLHEKKPALLLFSALGTPPFRSIKLRSRKPTCPACGTVGKEMGMLKEIDYVQFCGGARPDWETLGLVSGDPGFRIHAKKLEDALKSKRSIRLLDVRPETEFGICQLPSSINVPLNRLVADPSEYLPRDPLTETYIVCRLGNDSQIAADALRSVCSLDAAGLVRDVVGGLRAWSKHVDSNFPVY